MQESEAKALKLNPSLKSINDLINVSGFKVVLESRDPETVRDALQDWGKIEWPATYLMRGIKSAAETYIRAIGRTNIDYLMEPEEFFNLWTLPLEAPIF